MLSKPYEESSDGKSDVTSPMSSASRSRMALAYSVRFRRWISGRPGLGCAASPRSSAVSSNADQVLVGGIVGTLDADRRHRPGAELADDLLPHLRVRRRVGDVERIERQVAGLQAAVVAGDAVVADNCRRLRRGCGGWRNGLRSRLGMLRRDRGHPEAERQKGHASREGPWGRRYDATPPWCEHSPQHPVSIISAVRRRLAGF